MRARASRAAAAAALVAFALACPSRPRVVAYDLAARAVIAERGGGADVLLFGTPAAEPRLVEGFHREASGALDPFLWSKQEAEVACFLPEVAARTAILELAPYRGVRDQALLVLLNGTPLDRLRLNDGRYRYRLTLPEKAQRPGENRLRFVFAAAASPADADPSAPDRRSLAAAFHSLVIGRASDPSLDDLLARDAPRPFAVTEEGGVPRLSLVGPASVRFAVRLPEAAELRFTPELHPGARAAAAEARLRITLERAGRPLSQLATTRLEGRGASPREQVVRLPGAAGEIVRVGIEVEPGPSGRFAWVTLRAPRILGRTGADPLEPGPFTAAENARADALRRALSAANVLLVVLDAARAQQLGAYGYGRATTPEIDRIAAEGVVFERVYTPAVYTLGAMPSVWTSQHPDRHHSEVSFSARLPKDRLTLAELLSGQGVHTAGFVANAVAGSAFGFDRGFVEFQEVFRTLGSRGDVFRRVAPAFFAANRDRRFFLYVHFREPHFPYDPEPPFDTMFGPDGPIPKASRRDPRFFADVNQGRRPFSPEEREHLVRLYDGNLAFADREVGQIRRTLEAAGLLERTVVIVAADHGEELHEHGWIGHNVHVFEPSIRVPLVVRFPRSAGVAPRRVGALVDLLDLAPTIADVMGVLGKAGSLREFQGRSLLPVLLGAPGKPAVLSRTVWDRPRYALRDERFKFFFDTRTGEEHLYDLATDPGESRDVGPAEPLRSAYYREALHGWTLQLGRRRAASAEEARLTPEQCENLKSLGYIQSECP